HFWKKVRNKSAVAIFGEVGGRSWFYGHIFMQQDTCPMAIDAGGGGYSHARGLNCLFRAGHGGRGTQAPRPLACGPNAGSYDDGTAWVDEGINTFVAREGTTKR